jgi:hypothetical protein
MMNAKQIFETQICGLLSLLLFSIKIMISETIQNLIKAVSDYKEGKRKFP